MRAAMLAIEVERLTRELAEAKAMLKPIAAGTHVIVPKKATKQMVEAAYNRDHDGTTHLYFKLWEAMIAAVEQDK